MSDSSARLSRQGGGFAGPLALLAVLVAVGVGGSFVAGSRGRAKQAAPPSKRVAVAPQPPPKEPVPQDLPQPYPELIATSAGKPFVSGPVIGGKAGVVVDPTRKVVHAMRWPDASLVAFDPQTGNEIYVHAKGDAPLAVVGNRLLAQGNDSLWILDTHDGRPVGELPLPMLPPVLDRSMKGSSVRVEQCVGDVVLVRIHRDESVPVREGARTRFEHRVEDYAFALDVGSCRVVASPDGLAPVEVVQVLDGLYFPGRGGSLHAFSQDGPPNQKPRWKAWLRTLYSPAPKVLPPSPPLPQPWPQPEATGEGRAFEPGRGVFSSSSSGLADPTRGVYHLARNYDKDLAAFDPKTGRPIYTHAGGEAPIAVLGNRLLAQSAGTLWILDTHDGTVVYKLESPCFPPLLSEGGRSVAVRSWRRANSTLLVETYWSEPQEPQPGDVERSPATVTRYGFGIDMATGQISAPPAESEELEKTHGVGSFWLELHNETARGHSQFGARGESLWEYRMRSLRVLPPIKVEDDGR